MQFSAPAAGGETLKPADLEGHVLVVEAEEYVASMTTSFGDKDAIRVTVHDITDGTTTASVLWFSGVLVGSLKNRIGEKVLALMGRGTAKAGQSAPWILVDASTNPAAVQAATAYLTGQVADTLTAPAAAPVKAAVKKAPASELDAALANLAGAGLTN